MIFVTPRQQGMALVMGLVLLLVVTLLAVSMMRGTTMQERMSANNQQNVVTFQQAEAAIRVVMDELRAVKPSPSGSNNLLITALNNGANTTDTTKINQTLRTVNNSSQSGSTNNVNSSATMVFTGNSTLAGFGSKFQSFNFTITATAAQTNTGASSTNQQGVSRAAPALETN